MSQQIPSQGPLTDGPADPEHDPTASYALEPDYVAALTRRVLSSTGEAVLVRSPLGGAPLAHIPQSSDADVAGAAEDAPGQGGDVVGLEGVRRRRVVLGIGRAVGERALRRDLLAHVPRVCDVRLGNYPSVTR